MKRLYKILFVLCCILGILITGFTTENPEDTPLVGQTDMTEITIPKTPVDFSLNSNYVIFGESDNTRRGYIRPGRKLTLSARVYKTISSAGGGWVEFYIDGEKIDSVPFFMKSGNTYVTAKTNYILPFDKYLGLEDGEQTPVHFEARVLADDITEDTTGTDNIVSVDTFVQGVEIEANDRTADCVIASLKTTSELGDNIAVPGKSLVIHVALQCQNAGESRVRVYVGDQMLYNNHIFTSIWNTPRALNGFPYYVPWSATGTLKIRIELENGRQAKFEIPVASYDYEIRHAGIGWEVPLNTAPGNRVSISCQVGKDSGISFYDSNSLSVVFVVNGVASEPIKEHYSAHFPPHMIEVAYFYTIPEDCTWPLDVQAFVDPGDVFVEKNENNNIAGAEIPISFQGVDGPDLSISAENLWYYPSVFEAGQNVELFAAVYNGSSAPAGWMKVKFYVNGIQIDAANDTYRGTIRGGQYHIFHETWRAPDNLSTVPVFTVEVVPAAGQEQDDPSDNSASTELEVIRPDIYVDDIFIYSDKSGGKLVSKQEAHGIATVHNAGAVSASSVQVAFYINGAVVGSQTVDLPPFGSIEVSVPFTMPEVLDETPLGDTINGLTGYIRQEPGVGSAELSVKVDPQNSIMENNEDNNNFGPITLEINTAPKQGSIYVYTKEITGDVLPDVTINITANGKTASAVTNADGVCTFKYVPFGPYELTATKSGFNQAGSYDEVLYEGSWSDKSILYLDDYSYINGSITAPGEDGLSDVEIEVVDRGMWLRTNSDGDYSMKVPPGSYTLKYMKAGYNRVYQDITLTKAQTVTRNIVMTKTNLAYMYGWVYDEAGEDFPNMNVAVLNAAGQILSSATTDSEGYYELVVPISAPTVTDISVRVSGQGHSKEFNWELSQGVESRCIVSFQPVSNDDQSGTEQISSIGGKVTPWVIYNKIPGTLFTEEIEVEVIYGAFDINAYMMVEDSVINDLFFETTPGYWYTGRVEGSWNPVKFLAKNMFTVGSDEIAGFIFPLNIPIKGEFYSNNRTQVRIKKISILSDGLEVCAPYYPEAIGDYDFSPEVAVNWDNVRIKFYLYVSPDDGAANVIAGYHCEKVLIEWDPKEKIFTKIGYYAIVKDSNGNNTYIDYD